MKINQSLCIGLVAGFSVGMMFGQNLGLNKASDFMDQLSKSSALEAAYSPEIGSTVYQQPVTDNSPLVDSCTADEKCTDTAVDDEASSLKSVQVNKSEMDSEPSEEDKQKILALRERPGKMVGLTKQDWAEQLSNISFAQFPTYKAKNEKWRILTFVDPSCPACQRYVKKISELNDAGITVVLAPYPRHGKNTSAFKILFDGFCRQSEGDYDVTQKFNTSPRIYRTCKNTALKSDFDKAYVFASLNLNKATPISFTSNGLTILANQKAGYFVKALEWGDKLKAVSDSSTADKSVKASH